MRLKLPRLSDALIALGLFAILLLGNVLIHQELNETQPPLGFAAIGLTALMTLPLAWRQRAPATVLWVTTLTWVVFTATDFPDAGSVLGLVVALNGVGLYLPRRTALAHGIGAILAAVLWTLVGSFGTDFVHWYSVAITLIALVVSLAIGVSDNRRQTRLTELELADAQQASARKAATIGAVRAERTRIARELHDVVAHEVTVMTLQAEGAKRLAANADPRVAEALQTISDSGRTGLLEMQRMIGVLRTTDMGISGDAQRGNTAIASSAMYDDLLPMPSLAALPDLVQQVEDAGLPVSLEVLGSAHVPAGVELSAFRIVQESLTNAMKHAGPGAHATVTVTREAAAVTVTVEDDGRGVISEAMHSGGHGIDGMRERIASLGGTLAIGPRPGGGYRVHAALPSGDDQVAMKRDRPAAAASNREGEA